MQENELNELLEKLHHEIEHSPTLDADQLAQLRHIEGDIRELLDRSTGKKAELQPDNVRQMEDAIITFELTHPTISSTFSKLMEILSNAGI